jgi:hypothetical protein
MDAMIKRVDIVFENCEFCRLLPHMFKGLAICNVTKSYWINCFQYEKGEVNTHSNCHNFFITIKPSRLKTKTEMGGITDTSLKKRLLSCNDITHVQIYFEDGTNEYIGVPWEGEHYTNELQKVEIDGKSLTIEISNRKEK